MTDTQNPRSAICNQCGRWFSIVLRDRSLGREVQEPLCFQCWSFYFAEVPHA